MTKPIFYSEKFEIDGISVPEIELKKGNLIRIYVPNFKAENSPLGFDFVIELIKRFQIQKPDFLWAKEFRQNTISKLLNPLTVNKYLRNKMRINADTAKRITNEIGINLTDKYDQLSFTNKKGLIIKALFEKYNSIILDYYGVDVFGIQPLEKLVNFEIEKGKSAIAFDRMEYILKKEPFENIKQIKITVANSTENDYYYSE
jgi:hypothetical protein